MTMTDLSELVTMLADLRRKAAKRRDVAGYAANLEALEMRIAALEARRVAALDRDAQNSRPPLNA